MLIVLLDSRYHTRDAKPPISLRKSASYSLFLIYICKSFAASRICNSSNCQGVKGLTAPFQSRTFSDNRPKSNAYSFSNQPLRSPHLPFGTRHRFIESYRKMTFQTHSSSLLTSDLLFDFFDPIPSGLISIFLISGILRAGITS